MDLKIVKDTTPGAVIPSYSKICEAAGGNPKNSRDMGKIKKLVQEELKDQIEIQPGKRLQLVKRITLQSDDDKK